MASLTESALRDLTLNKKGGEADKDSSKQHKDQLKLTENLNLQVRVVCNHSNFVVVFHVEKHFRILAKESSGEKYGNFYTWRRQLGLKYTCADS